MLVPSRKKGQRIVVPGYGVSIQVLAVNGKSIRVGISAPPEVKVLRGEVRDRVGRAVVRPPEPG